MASSQQRLLLDSLAIHEMASGYRCLSLSERVSWEEFPDYANALLAILRGSRTSVADGPDMRLWQVLVEGTELRLVYDDYPQSVSLESNSDEGDRVLQLVLDKLSGTKSRLP